MSDAYHRYGPVFIVGLALYLTFLLIRPFLLTIFTAAIIAYIFHPLNVKIEKKVKKSNISAAIILVAVVLIVVLPSIIFMNSLISEIPSAYRWASTQLSSGAAQNFLDAIAEEWGIQLSLSQVVQTLASKTLNYLQNVLASLPDKILNVSIGAIFLFFFLRDGKYFVQSLFKYLPFDEHENKTISTQMKNMMDAVIFGQLITAVIQATIAFIGFFILGVDSPFVWGLLTLMLSIIPMLGPAIVYGPLSISMIVGGYLNDQTGIVIRGIILLVYGVTIISSVDNFVKPILISDKVKIHSAIVLLGVIGGLAQFGVIGVVLGPLILAFIATMFKFYHLDKLVYQRKSKS